MLKWCERANGGEDGSTIAIPGITQFSDRICPKVSLAHIA